MGHPLDHAPSSQRITKRADFGVPLSRVFFKVFYYSSYTHSLPLTTLIMCQPSPDYKSAELPSKKMLPRAVISLIFCFIIWVLQLIAMTGDSRIWMGVEDGQGCGLFRCETCCTLPYYGDALFPLHTLRNSPSSHTVCSRQGANWDDLATPAVTAKGTVQTHRAMGLETQSGVLRPSL